MKPGNLFNILTQTSTRTEFIRILRENRTESIAVSKIAHKSSIISSKSLLSEKRPLYGDK